jgi:hypothetical protein
MPEIHEIWDPNEWEQHVYGLLQDRHGPLNVHKVPARHKGDHGLDYYSLEDQVAYQCYAVQEPCEVAARADKQKAKITTDLNKFCTKKAELSGMFGSVQMARWVLVVPLHDSSQLNAHSTAKTAEVKSFELAYVAPNFQVMVQDLESFDVLSRAARTSARRAISILTSPTSLQEIEDWSSASETLVSTLKVKLAKRVGTDAHKLDESVDLAVRWFLDRENALEALRSTAPQIHEALMGVILRRYEGDGGSRRQDHAHGAISMTLRLRHLRLRAETEVGTFGADLPFTSGLNVIWADNTKGKSTCLQGILYATRSRTDAQSEKRGAAYLCHDATSR